MAVTRFGVQTRPACLPDAFATASTIAQIYPTNRTAVRSADELI